MPSVSRPASGTGSPRAIRKGARLEFGVGGQGHTVSVHSSSAFNSLRHRLSVRGPVRLRGESAEPWDRGHAPRGIPSIPSLRSIPFRLASRSPLPAVHAENSLS